MNRFRQLYNGSSGARIIHNILEERGVKDTFLYTGGAIMPLVDCFHNSNLNYYINNHEQCSGHAATGYAKSTGKPGVCIVTSGPGLTNMITPMTDATNDSTPLIVLSGNVSRENMGTGAFQECPSVEISKPVTKWSYSIKDVLEIPDVMNHAFKVATSGKKGSVHIDIPKCIQTSIFKDTSYSFSDKYTAHTSNRIYKHTLDKNDISRVKALIQKSERPIIIVGQGCANSYEELRYFAKMYNIPVTSTIHGMGIYNENDQLSLKFLGMHGSAVANMAVQRSDLIINLGSRFDDRTTGNTDQYAPQANLAFAENRGGIVHVNIDSGDINKTINSHYNFNMDCRAFLQGFLHSPLYNPREDWIYWLQTVKDKHRFRTNDPNNGELNTQMVIKSIGEYLENKQDYLVTTGVGNHQMWAAQFINWTHPRQFITSGSLGVMGAGLPYAIGAQIANPRYKVIDIDGDGSFNHTLGDLKTVYNYNLPIKIAVMNDGEMSMVRTWEKLFFNERYTATNLGTNPDYVRLAESFGIKGIYCSTCSTLEKTVETFLNYPGPIVCEFKTNSDQCYPLVKPGEALDSMLFGENHEDTGPKDTKHSLSDLPG